VAKGQDSSWFEDGPQRAVKKATTAIPWAAAVGDGVTASMCSFRRRARVDSLPRSGIVVNQLRDLLRCGLLLFRPPEAMRGAVLPRRTAHVGRPVTAQGYLAFLQLGHFCAGTVDATVPDEELARLARPRDSAILDPATSRNCEVHR
jgi:hypothetical protein